MTVTPKTVSNSETKNTVCADAATELTSAVLCVRTWVYVSDYVHNNILRFPFQSRTLLPGHLKVSLHEKLSIASWLSLLNGDFGTSRNI